MIRKQSGIRDFQFSLKICPAFLSENLIVKERSEGRKIYYSITDKGEKFYQDEVNRLRKCVFDADKADHEKLL